MRRLRLACLLLLAMPGCIAIRGGGGWSHRGDPSKQAGTYDAEVGLVVPVPLDLDGASWIASPLAIVRSRTSDSVWAAGGLELARRVGGATAQTWPRGDRSSGDPAAGNYVGGRIELGRDDVGRYAGGAVAVRRYFMADADPVHPSISLVLNVGAYLGPVKGPAVGLHLLFGFN